jgi:hypothetical protein
MSLSWVSQAILFHDMLLMEKNVWKNLKYGREVMCSVCGTQRDWTQRDWTQRD